MLHGATKELRSDCEIVAAAVKKTYDALMYATSDLAQDEDLLKLALLHSDPPSVGTRYITMSVNSSMSIFLLHKGSGPQLKQ